MVQLTVTLSEECSTRITEMVETGEYEDESAALDHLITRGEQVTDIEQRIERVRNEMGLFEQRVENNQLVERVPHK